MLAILRLVILAATILVPAILISWADEFHLRFGVPVLVILLLCMAIVSRLRKQHHPRAHARRRQRIPVNVLHEVLRTIVQGLAVVALMTAYFFVLEHVPGIRISETDGDRHHIEDVLSALEANRNWLEAEKIVDTRLLKPITVEWKHELATRQVRYLVLAARANQGDDARGLLAKAIKCAETHQLPTELPEADLRALKSAEELSRQRDEGPKLAARVKAELTTTHQSELSEYKSRSIRAWAKGRFEELMRFGDALSKHAPDAARGEYQSALMLAEKYALDRQSVVDRLRQVDAAIEHSKPQVLPQGSRGTIAATHELFAPAMFVADLAITAPDGKAFVGLQLKDVSVSQRGNRLPHIAIVPTRSSATPWHLAILLDVSDSMRGGPLQEARTGIATLLSQIPPGCPKRLYSFSNRLVAHTPWTKDRDSVQAVLATLTTEGRTSLYSSIAQVERDMAEVRGPKAVVLVTDGRDSSGHPIPTELASILRQAGVAWHVVGLQSADLDTRTLKQISEATGGTYLSAARTSDLVARLSEVTEALRSDLYRLAILGVDPSQPVAIAIGRDPAIQLTVNPIAVTGTR